MLRKKTSNNKGTVVDYINFEDFKYEHANPRAYKQTRKIVEDNFFVYEIHNNMFLFVDHKQQRLSFQDGQVLILFDDKIFVIDDATLKEDFH